MWSSAEDLDRLRGALDAADLGSLQAPAEPACSDCFVYDIAYGGQTFTYVEAAEVPATVRGAVAELERIVTAHMPAAQVPPKG